MNWTKAERYRPYDSYSKDYIANLKKQVSRSPWRACFHIEPEIGLLNDPNGFSYFNGRWHLFYQWFPYGPVQGLKSWQHVTSKDLIHFVPDELRLLPDTEAENYGSYSGSALSLSEDELFLMYTGNHREPDGKRIPLQIGATLNRKNQLTKWKQPLIMPPFDQVTEHFRDPQIFRFGSDIYAILGAQNKEKKGFIKIYQATDKRLTQWRDLGELKFSDDKLGYMIECPNLVFVAHQPILIFCPQGLDKQVADYENIYPNMVLVGERFDPLTKELINPSLLSKLDDGFDCYATQAFNAPDGKAYEISWIGLPDTEYPTDDYGYQGALSLVKELSIDKEGKLHQQPVSALKTLRKNQEEVILGEKTLPTDNCYELAIDFSEQASTVLHLCEDKEGQSALQCRFDKKTKLITLKRGTEERHCQVEIHQIQILMDRSIVEIFVNNGEKVLSSRIFPSSNQTYISSESALKLTYWSLIS